MRSNHRRLGTTGHRQIERQQYDKAVEYIFSTLKNEYKTLVVNYEELGDRSVRTQIQSFTNLQPSWISFRNMNKSY